MMLRQPAGDDRSGGKSAESVVQAWATDGDGENISATVCGAPRLPSCAICLHLQDLLVKAGGSVRRLFLFFSGGMNHGPSDHQAGADRRLQGCGGAPPPGLLKPVRPRLSGALYRPRPARPPGLCPGAGSGVRAGRAVGGQHHVHPVLADGPAGDPGGYPHLRPPGRGPRRQSIRYNNRRKSLWTSAISRAPLWPW